MQAPETLPLYVQISELLIREIAAGRLLDGERLPPERDMAAEHGISVGTLRKALADLDGKGMLERRQGSGNYVRTDHGPGDSVYAFFRLELPEGGGLPTAELLAVDETAKPACLPAFGESARGHRIRRLRRLNGAPAAVEEIWLDGAAATGPVTCEALSESLYLFYRSTLGLRIMRAEDKVGLGPCPGWAPAAFGKAPGAALPLVERLSWAQGPRAVEYSRTWVDPDRARYVQRMK